MFSTQKFLASCEMIMVLSLIHLVIIVILTPGIQVQSIPVDGSEDSQDAVLKSAAESALSDNLSPATQSDDLKKNETLNTTENANSTNTTEPVGSLTQDGPPAQETKSLEPVDVPRSDSLSLTETEQGDSSSQISQLRDTREGDFSREDSIPKDIRDNLMKGHAGTGSDSQSHHQRQHNKAPHTDGVVKDVKMRVIDINQDEEDCGRSVRGPFRKLHQNSKFFHDYQGMYTYEQGIEKCIRYGLIPADMDDIGDHKSLQNFISSVPNDGCGPPKFFIGMNETETKGLYKKWYNGKNISFQNFHRSQPDDKNLTENCVVLSKELAGSPVGMSSFDCNKTAHMLCMFKPGTDCFKESNETMDNVKNHLAEGLKLLMNLSSAAYFVSNFPRVWSNAMAYCNEKDMVLITFDKDINMKIFQSLLNWQNAFTKRVPIPPIEYFTAGRFRNTHMSAPIFWHTSPGLVPPEEILLPHVHEEKGHYNLTFTFSGVYRWTSKKKRDPGGPIMYRRDLCLTFAFEGDGEDPTPVVRATNCDLPCYFVCVKKYKKVIDLDY